MVVYDEETLNEALALAAIGPVRFSDTYMFVIITEPSTLETRCRTALGRGDIAIVAPVGTESTMEDHTTALRRVKARRKVQEKKDVQTFFREHPDKVEKVEKRLRKEG